MLIVKTDIRPSPIHGIGVFAREFIPKGTLVWTFNPIIDREVSESDIEKLSDATKQFIRDHTYYEDDGRLILSNDSSIYLNHSDNPNINGVALRDIQPGEEITEDYRLFKAGLCSAFLNDLNRKAA